MAEQKVMQMLRQTGRTERMLKAAYIAANRGKNVFIIHADQSLLDARRATMLCYDNIAHVTFANAGSLIDLHTLKPLVEDDDAVIFIDHDVVEKHFAEHVKILHQYDTRLNIKDTLMHV